MIVQRDSKGEQVGGKHYKKSEKIKAVLGPSTDLYNYQTGATVLNNPFFSSQ